MAASWMKSKTYSDSRIFSCIVLIVNMAFCKGMRALRMEMGVLVLTVVVSWISSLSDGILTAAWASCICQ